ncbi:MAG: carboxypeptidase regulatory-like domain-containing protein [Terriglobia bacterium]
MRQDFGLLRFFMVLLIAGALGATAWGQVTGGGVIRGTVLDPAGAVIPSAAVTLTNQSTGVSFQTRASSAGLFNFSAVDPGPYSLAVSVPGFMRWSTSLVLLTGQTVTVNPSLKVGSTTSTVNVVAAASNIDTTDMTVSNTKTSTLIHQLPLNGRTVTTLFNLTPGVEGGSNPETNGLKVGATQILQDGMSIQDRFGGGISRIQPGLDSVSEFRIDTNGADARYVTPAAVILDTKSGSNQIHGDLFADYRGSSGGLTARQRQSGPTVPKLVRNEFGGAVGGPVYIPKIYNGRNKTFFFVTYEGLRQATSTFQTDSVPTAAMWNGDFSNVFDPSGAQYNIYNPYTTDASGIRQQFAGNIIPSNMISPLWTKLHSLTAAPTTTGDPNLGPNFLQYYPQNTSNNLFTTRVDQRISSKDNLWARFTRDTSNFVQPGGEFGDPAPGVTNGLGTGVNSSTVYNGVIDETHSFSPSLLSEFSFAVNYNPNHQGTLASSTNWAQNLNLPNPFNATGWPTIYADSGLWQGNGDPWDANNEKQENFNQQEANENLTWVKARHTFEFGGSWRHERDDVEELQQSQGSHEFSGDWTALYDPANQEPAPFTGLGIADMALGIPFMLSNQYNRGFFKFRQTELGLYAQDIWKVNQRLTLDLGVRWDRWSPYSEANNRLLNVDLATYASQFQVVTPGNHTMQSLPGIPPSVLDSWSARGLTYATANQVGLPSGLLPANNRDFSPRLGAAFMITRKTVLRGGYGIYYWTMPLSQILQAARTNPPLNLRYVNPIGSPNGDSTFADSTVPQTSDVVGQATVNINGLVTIPPSAQSFTPWDYRNWKDDMAQEWNVTLERDLGHNTILSLIYVGDHGSNLEQQFSINAQEPIYNYTAQTGQLAPGNHDLLRVNPNWSFNATNHTGYSNSNSIQAQVEHRFAGGLAFQWFYVWTRALTTSNAGGFSSGGTNINAVNGSNVAPQSNQLLGAPSTSYAQLLASVYNNDTNVPAQRVTEDVVYDLPLGKGRRFGSHMPRALDAVVGGWELTSIGTWDHGFWQAYNSGQWAFQSPALNSNQRLALTYNGSPQLLWFAGDFNPAVATNVSQTALQALVPASVGQRRLHELGPGFNNQLPLTLANGKQVMIPVSGAFNPTIRQFFLGPPAWNVDFSLIKRFKLTERLDFRLEGDFFNAFNHPNDVNPDPVSGLVNLGEQANPAREIQIYAHLDW